MYLNITDNETGNNKGSSGTLVHYLEKENRMEKVPELEYWFNQSRQDVQAYEVRSSMDGNVAKLCKDEAKFFLLNISPSQKEIRFLKKQYGEEGAKEKLKEYAVNVMDEYARNFKRPGIESSKDLLWYGKLEHHRYYSHKDPEVKRGIRQRGQLKEGEQMHIQVIVSRKDITNKIKLSPMNNSRGKNAEHSKKVGQFDRSAFKTSGERIFDQQFGFDRQLAETFRYANTHKNGQLKNRINLHEEMRLARSGKIKKQKVPEVKEESWSLDKPQTTYVLQSMLKTEQDDSEHIPFRKRRKRNNGLHL